MSNISTPEKSVCIAGIFYCSEDCMIILTVGEQYIRAQHMTAVTQ